MLAPFEDGLKPRAQGEGGLAGPRPAAERDDPDVGVEQEVQGNALLGRPAVQPEGVAVPTDQAHLLVGADPTQATAARRVQHQPGVARQLRSRRVLDSTVLVELSHGFDRHVEVGHPRPAGVDGELSPILLRVQSHRRGLDPHRQVLADDGDVVAVGGEVLGHREDPGVVVAQPKSRGQDVRVRVVELDAHRAAEVADRQGAIQPTVRHPQVIEHPQRRPGEVAQLRVVAFGLQLGDDDDREHHLVFGEPRYRSRIGQQDRRVQNVGLSTRTTVRGRPRSSHAPLLGDLHVLRR
ncbi:MAG: hypothetical protein BWY91_01874 [bacterium ADurb.BinA028]|nr:MAG: hypothetical protein BWY91_01874 [bacterium ADurb.BinA028]